MFLSQMGAHKKAAFLEMRREDLNDSNHEKEIIAFLALTFQNQREHPKKIAEPRIQPNESDNWPL